MQVNLVVEVFREAEALTDLLNLIRCFADGRHDWVADPLVVEAAKKYLAEHAPRLAETYADLARKGTVSVAWSGSDRPTVVHIDAADLSDHVADLCRPAVLVVEDQDSDGCFVRALAHVFRAERVRSALARGWLEIEHGGGGSLVKVAESAAGRYRRCVRIAALLDSDRMVPDQRTGSHDKADRLARVGVVVHVLALREAENYVPNRVLQSIGRPRDASRKLDLLKKLKLQQRGYFDMKNGFEFSGGSPKIATAQLTLFDGLDQRVAVGLCGGFGKDLLKRMENARDNLTERDFASLGADVVAELCTLLVKFARVI